jgi:HAMP domain-containing protein
MNTIAEGYNNLDFQGRGLQNRLRREALGLTRRDLAGLLSVRESTIYRWEHGTPAHSVEAILDSYESAAVGIRGRIKSALDRLGPTGRRIDHEDMHITVPKPGASVGDVFVFDDGEPVLRNPPAGLVRAIAGRLITLLRESPYRVFARETDDAGMLLFAQVGRGESERDAPRR